MIDTAACWHGYMILEGLLPVLRSSQIALTTETNPNIHRCFRYFFERQECDKSSGIFVSPKKS
ncbi:MAG: hypothetical protein ACTSPB_24525 [Candidatus Thorarchaeota archaeon]